MTKNECLKIKALLQHIKDKDAYVNECIAIVDKQLAMFEKQKGQIKENYEYECNWL